MKKKDRKRSQKGFTLVEVLVAFTIMLAASQILLLSIILGAKMGKRTEEIKELYSGIGEHMMDKTACVSGMVRLDLGVEDGDIEVSGWLYSGEEEADDLVHVIWVDEWQWSELSDEIWSEESGE